MELLCIKSHSIGVVVFGNTYPLIRTSDKQNDACSCVANCVDVGIKRSKFNNPIKNIDGAIVKIGSIGICSKCDDKLIVSDTWWICKSLFGEIGEEQEGSQYQNSKELIEK